MNVRIGLRNNGFGILSVSLCGRASQVCLYLSVPEQIKVVSLAPCAFLMEKGAHVNVFRVFIGDLSYQETKLEFWYMFEDGIEGEFRAFVLDKYAMSETAVCAHYDASSRDC